MITLNVSDLIARWEVLEALFLDPDPKVPNDDEVDEYDVISGILTAAARYSGDIEWRNYHYPKTITLKI